MHYFSYKFSKIAKRRELSALNSLEPSMLVNWCLEVAWFC